MTRQFVLASALSVGLALVGSSKAAQAQPSSPQSPAPPPLTAGWRDGFVVESENGDFRLHLGLLLQADGRFAFTDDDEVVNDSFLIRRLRPYLRGRLSERFEFFLNPDFAGGTLVVQDAYLDTVFAPAFRVRIGKGKSPFGLERLHPAANLLFFDRALPTSIVPNRDLGVQVLGDISGSTVSYVAGVLNGVPDGGSADLDSGDSKDLVGRLIVRPFRRKTGSPLRGLTFAISGSTGRQTGAAALPALRTSSIQQTYFSYSGASGDGRRTRYSPQLSYYHRVFGGFAEYVHSAAPIRKGTMREEIAHAAWQVAGSIVLTGETATDSVAGVCPRAKFNFGHGHFGAFQIAARYHALQIDDSAFTLGFASADASRKAEAWTLGLNWYFTQNFKYVFNFERTVFDDDADGARAPENAFVFRAQLNF